MTVILYLQRQFSPVVKGVNFHFFAFAMIGVIDFKIQHTRDVSPSYPSGLITGLIDYFEHVTATTKTC